MSNILITRPFRLFIPQLIVDVQGVDKMRQQYIKTVKKGDIVPEEYFTMSCANTIQTTQSVTVEIDSQEVTKDELATSVDLDGQSKIIYSTKNVSYKGKGELTEEAITVTIDDFVYEDL